MIFMLPKTEGPHYLAQLEISREGDTILFEIVDTKGYQKALYTLPAEKLANVLALLDIKVS